MTGWLKRLEFPVKIDCKNALEMRAVHQTTNKLWPNLVFLPK